MNNNEKLRLALRFAHHIKAENRRAVQVGVLSLSMGAGVGLDSKIVNARTMRYARNFDK